MKHFRLILPLLLLALILSGCAGEVQPYEYVRDDISVTVDPIQCRITCGEDVYLYEVEKTEIRTSYVIQYPNGAIFQWTSGEYGGAGGWTDDYDESTYIPGEILVDALDQAVRQAAPHRERNGNVGIGLLLIGLGSVSFFIPHLPFYLKYGWRFENAEPSDAYITVTRIGGAIAAVVGLVWCVI